MRRPRHPKPFEMSEENLRAARRAAALAVVRVGGAGCDLIFERMEEIWLRHGPGREAARKARIEAILSGAA